MWEHTSLLQSLLFTRVPSSQVVGFQQCSSSMSGQHFILQHGTQPHGYSTPRCSITTFADSVLPLLPPTIGSGILLSVCHLPVDHLALLTMLARFTPQMFTTMGYGVYFFFASLMILSAIFVYFLIPETKNIPLEAIDRLFDRRLKASQAHGLVWAELEQEEEALRVGLAAGLEKEDHMVSQVEEV
jgi:hypothetical protein